MSKLSRLIFREIVSGAALGLGLFTFALFMYRLGAIRLFELLVRSSAPARTIGYLFSLILPFVFTFAIPIGVLVGTLIGLSRMASDGEITAMRAAGVPSRKVLGPVLVFSFLAMGAAGCCSLWLNPLAIRESYRIMNELIAEQMTAEIQPRVFGEQFPKTILFVGDVLSGPTPRWRNIFIADLTPPAERKNSAKEASDSPLITFASEALAIPDVAHNRIQLHLLNGSSHEIAKDTSEYYNTTFPIGDRLLEAEKPNQIRARAYIEMDTKPLAKEARGSVDARIELHQRLALPLACVLLALVGIPLGVSSRKSGKSAAFVLTMVLALLYFTGMISLIGLARQGTISVPVAAWTPNVLFAIAGIIFVVRLERPGDRDLIGVVRAWFGGIFSKVGTTLTEAAVPVKRSKRGGLRLMPQLVDTYILSSFLFYFALFLASFVLMTHVFTFFELLGDMLKNKIPMQKMVTYLFFLTPKLIYDFTPLSAMVGTLVTFGVLSKQNEVTAFKACGVSLYRLAAPVLLMSMVLSALLFAFDYYYVPEANRIQDGLRAEIKGKAVQTYLHPERKWIYGRGSRIYNYKYFDPNENVMVGVSVYEIDEKKFRLRRHIMAERARWEEGIGTWIFQNGWSRDIDGIRVKEYHPFQAQTFPELDEPPNYFLQRVMQEKQMNSTELEKYIQGLRQSGFDTIRLQVQYHRKFSVPLFALIMAMISAPFAFMTGNRGAMAAVGVSFLIAIAYWSVSQLFEQIGNLNQLPPQLAAWSPDAVFLLAGLYFLARMKT